MKLRGSIALVTLALCGCRMGQDTYDYSGPVQGSPPIPYESTTARSGSVLSGTSPTSNGAAPEVPQPPDAPKLDPVRPSDDTITRQPAPQTIRR